MDTNLTVGQLIALATVAITVGGPVLVAFLRQRKSREDSAAVSAETIDTMARTVKSLMVSINEERLKRDEDMLKLERRLVDARAECSEEIRVLKESYEQRLDRMQQGHNDRVNSLKERIKLLECQVGNGNGLSATQDALGGE